MGPYNRLDSQPITIGPSSLSEDIHTATTFPSNAETQGSSPPKTCSVRGCRRKVDPGSGTKMCEVCRSRHRIYATTKRARRKLEKAAVSGMRGTSEQADNGASVSSIQVVAPDTNPDSDAVTPNAEWLSAQAAAPTTTTTWDHSTAIDPQLFSQSVSSTTSVNTTQDPLSYIGLHLSSYPPAPYVSSTSSELAGALTLPTDDKTNTTSYYRPRLSDGSLMQQDSTIPGSTAASLEAEKQDDEQSGEENENENKSRDVESQAIIPSERDASTDAGTVPAVEGSTRFCSVKGCKAVIPGPLSLSYIIICLYLSPSFVRLQNVPSLPCTIPDLWYHQAR
jgi:hypothetical protein